MIKKLLLLLILLVCTATFFFLPSPQKKTFSFDDLYFDLPHHKEWEQPTHPLPFIQTYKFLGSGGQSVAFISEDEKYVLKFFRYKPKKSQWLAKLLPLNSWFHDYKMRHLHSGTEANLASYNLAYNVDPKGVALLWVHLTKTDWINQTVQLVGPDGQTHNAKLDELYFVVQEPVEILEDLLKKDLENDDRGKAKQRIEKVLELYRDQYQKGIYDWGIGFTHNNGFVDDRPVHFDAGKMIPVPEGITEEWVIQRALDRLKKRKMNP